MVKPKAGQPWLQSYLGKTCVLENIQAEDINITDLAESLSKQCRFVGHCKGFYSVAQHSVYVAQLLPTHLQIYGLLHDAHEAIIGDISRPLKQLLRAYHPFQSDLDRIENEIQEAIYATLGISKPSVSEEAQVKTADTIMLATERRDLMGPCDEPWDHEGHVIPEKFIRIDPLDWKRARDLWFSSLADYLDVPDI